MADVPIVGYKPCICGNQVLEPLWQQYHGLCLSCYMSGEQRNLRLIDIRERGRTMTVRLPPVKRPKNKGSKGSKTNRQIRKHAEIAALKRLRAAFPAIYQELYAEERAIRGLAPVVRVNGGSSTPGD